MSHSVVDGCLFPRSKPKYDIEIFFLCSDLKTYSTYQLLDLFTYILEYYKIYRY